MKFFLVNLMFVIGVFCLAAPILNTWWIRYRVLRFREDIYQKRDELFDIAASKHLLWDKPVMEAIEHLADLAQSADVISVPMIMAILPHLPEGRPRQLVQDCEMQGIIDEWYAWSAKRTLEFLLKESLCGRVLYILTVGNLHEMQVERFVRSEATEDLRVVKLGPIKSGQWRSKPVTN